MEHFKRQNIFYYILILIILSEILFTPVAICAQLQEIIHVSEKQTGIEQSKMCCCDNESQCPVDSEKKNNHQENKCRCAYGDNIPSMLTNFDLPHFVAKSPYFTWEFQLIRSQPLRNIFHPPKN